MEHRTFKSHALSAALLGSAVFLIGCSDEAIRSSSAPVITVEPMVISGDSAGLSAEIVAHTARRFPSTPARKGVVTAGDIDDTLNLASFQRYVSSAKKSTGLPTVNFSRPFLARLTGANGKPAPGVLVSLHRPGAAKPFYSGYSGVNGDITVFPALLGAGSLSTIELRAFPDNSGQVFTQKLNTNNRRQNVALPFSNDWKPDFLDLAFVIDTTGSMGDELAWLTKELGGIVSSARRSAPGVNIRFALIAYRDRGDEFIVRNYGFTSKQSQMQAWLRAQSASGGGDYPEAAAAALSAAAALNWRRGKGERLMFHIADAPPHSRDAKAYLQAAARAAQKNVQVFGLGASGVAKESEFLMRQAAVQTGGRYIFLTDDSGVGNTHAEPTISCYRVTRLKDLMTRILRSELSGQRIEAPEKSVLRQVGSYQGGVCRN